MKVIALISGGIDSPVATALALQNGAEIVCAHFSNAPYSSEKTEEKVFEILRHLAQKYGKKIKLYIIPHGANLTEISRKCERKFTCVLCRRMMFRIASRIAEREKADALLTGESLGQVASQTLSNISAEFSASTKPILRPLLGMDKLEIERLAKGIGTFTASTKPAGCCEITPERPATKAGRRQIEEEEEKLDIEKLARESLKNAKTAEFKFYV